MQPLAQRHNLRMLGDGPTTLLLVHGLGTGQWVWREVAPALAAQHRVVLMDLAGCGDAPLPAQLAQYQTLDGHSRDLEAVARALRPGRLVLVVHSVAAMIGLLAELRSPDLFDAHVMVAPSPCYLNLSDYSGGFDADGIRASLDLLDHDTATWIETMAPVLMGAAADDPLSLALAMSMSRTDRQVLRQFARATFMGDHRQRLPGLAKPVALLQATDDPVVPYDVGRYMQSHLPDGRLEPISCAGHFPQLQAPAACLAAMQQFLNGLAVPA